MVWVLLCIVALLIDSWYNFFSTILLEGQKCSR